MENKNCLLCGKNKFKILHKHGILEKGGLILNFTNVICKNCGLVFISPRPSRQDYEGIYREYEKSRHNCQNAFETAQMVEGAKNSKKGEWVYNFLKEYLENGKEALDIGAGFGHISYGLQNTCGCNVCAVEPSKILAKLGKEILKINFFNGQFDDFAANNNKKFNVLIMHEVFEHFIDPADKLRQFKNLLLPDGVVYIEVPDVASFSKPADRFFDYMHPFNYSPKTFKELIYKNGYKIIKSDKDKKYRIRAVVVPAESRYPDVGADSFWKRGDYADILYFVRKRKIVDFLRRISCPVRSS